MLKLKILLVCVLVAFCAPATQFSKLAIITTAKTSGCWQNIKSFIIAADLEEEWSACQYLSDDYPAFASVTNMLVANSVLTNDQLTNILFQARDTAISDNLLMCYYTNSMNTVSGREAWHGKKIKESVDTNTLEKTTIYLDGTIFKDKPKTKTASATVQAQNARLPKPAMTNGIPLRLARARMKAYEDSLTTNIVTVALKAGGSN